MAFFDDLNKKLSQIGQKTNNLSDSSRINALISKEENLIYSYQQQIGEIYLNLHTNDYEPEFETLVTQISESKSRIANLRDELQLLSGTRKCPQCSGNVDISAAFCPDCGFRMPINEAASKKKFCSSCGQPVADNLRFCTNCGNPVNAESNAEPNSQIYTPAAVIPDYIQQSPVAPVYTEPAYTPEFPEQPEAYEYNPPIVPEPTRKPEEAFDFEQPEISEFIQQPDEKAFEQPPVVPEFLQQTPAEQEPPHQPAILIFEQSTIPPEIPPRAKEQPNNSFCPKCGFVVTSDSAFCSECGTRIN